MKYVITVVLVLSFILIPATAEEVIKEYSGNGWLTTEPLTVPDNWVVQWDYKGPYLQILINSKDSVPLGYAAQQTGPGSGSAVQPEGGTYILDINGAGEWKVKILKGK